MDVYKLSAFDKKVEMMAVKAHLLIPFSGSSIASSITMLPMEVTVNSSMVQLPRILKFTSFGLHFISKAI